MTAFICFVFFHRRLLNTTAASIALTSAVLRDARALISQPSSFYLCTIRQDVHHDWQRQQHAEPGHRALRHFLALQAHQRAQGEDGDALLHPSVGGGNLREGRGAEGPAVGGLNGKPAGRPVPRHPPERGSHLWNSGMECSAWL